MSKNSPVILIVEDEEYLVEAYQTKLELQQFTVLVARDGQEALDTLHDTHVDLVILDLMIPKIEGLEVLRMLKKNSDLKEIPVLIASNLDQKAVIDKGLALGADDFIVKSNISINELVAKVKKNLP